MMLGQKIVLATHNKGKVAELQMMLAPYAITVVSAAELDLPEPIESGQTFAENATIKALAAAQASGLPALADDSGLCLLGLDNWPGINTADWTKRGIEGLTEINNRLLETDNHKAESVCVLALAQPSGTVEIFEGRVQGQWVWPPHGDNGFGYDPVFMPATEKRTYAEMGKQRNPNKAIAIARFRLLSICISALNPVEIKRNTRGGSRGYSLYNH